MASGGGTVTRDVESREGEERRGDDGLVALQTLSCYITDGLG